MSAEKITGQEQNSVRRHENRMQDVVLVTSMVSDSYEYGLLMFVGLTTQWHALLAY